MKKLFLLLVSAMLISSVSFAQKSKSGNPSYKTAFGFRFYPTGISVKSNLAEKKRSVEFIGYFKDGFTLSTLYYWNFTLNQPMNLKFYAGGSLQAGFRDKDNGGGGIFGVGGVVGLDYKFLKLPINISADYQPSFQFGKGNEFQNWGGLAVRFCL